MSDGPTGIQVAPIPTESEMNRVRQIFEYAVNAIVQASTLARQVEELSASFNKLDTDYRTVMARNDELVASLSEVRMQRDQAQSELVTTKAERDATNGKLMIEQDANGALDRKVTELQIELRKANDDRDYAIDEWHKAAKEAADAKALLADIKAKLGIVDPPKVAPQAEPIPQPSLSEVRSEATSAEPRPLSEAEHATASDEPEKPSYTYNPSSRW